MKDHQVAILFHDLIGPASSIRSFLYFILMKKETPLDPKTENYLKECLNYCEQLIQKLQDLREVWETTNLPSSPGSKPPEKA